MKILDDFISDKTVLDIYKDDTQWTKELSRGWYRGWWHTPPTSFWEHLVCLIWKNYPDVEKAHGFEWWTNTHANSGLSWHQDKDEILAEETGTIITPEYGSIFYPYPHTVEGGFLEIMADDDPDKVEKILPKYNRLVMFDPSNHHRVSKVYSGERKAFIANLWMNHTPQL